MRGSLAIHCYSSSTSLLSTSTKLLVMKKQGTQDSEFQAAVADALRTVIPSRLSQTAFAKKCGVGQTTITNLLYPGKRVTSPLSRTMNAVVTQLHRMGVEIKSERMDLATRIRAEQETHPFFEFAQMAEQLSEDHRRIWRENWKALVTTPLDLNLKIEDAKRKKRKTSEKYPILDLSKASEDDLEIMRVAISMLQQGIKESGITDLHTDVRTRMLMFIIDALEKKQEIAVAKILKKLSRPPNVNKGK